MKDLIIIGGGPAGVAAGVYAARKHLQSVLIAEEIGGQSVVSDGIQNWIGTVNIPGSKLAEDLKAHLEAYKADKLEMVLGERVAKLEGIEGGFKATSATGKSYEARAVLIASGAARRKLEVPGAAEFEHKGLTYCASCDGPLFAGQDVVVVGGGNAGFETAAQLLAYAKSVTLLHRRHHFKADAITVEKVLAHPNMKALPAHAPVAVKGEKFVTGLVVENLDTKEQTELPVTGIFVEVGVIPSTDFAKDLVKLDAVGRVVADPRNQRTYQANREAPASASDARHGEGAEGAVRAGTVTDAPEPRNDANKVLEGVWAAGDCTDELYHQNNIAAGDAVKALEDIYQWIKTR
ncbi:MAG: FAD-dependent oxidoreductase [Minisyncoccia bacterium]